MTRGKYITRLINTYIAPLCAAVFSVLLYLSETQDYGISWSTMLLLMAGVSCVWTFCCLPDTIRNSVFLSGIVRNLRNWWNTELVPNEQRRFLEVNVDHNNYKN